MKKQNKNFLYNIIYQIFVFIIPIVTTPYVSRVLGADNVGVYSYTYSFVYYFMLLSMLGINNYGAREIAKCKGQEEINKKFKSIYLLQILLNLICIILYLIFVIFIKYDKKNIMVIQSIFLVSVAFDVNWFFFGKEKFKITIKRNIVIKLISLIFIFLFVKNENDLWIYTLIMSGATLISQLYLWFFLKKEVKNVKIELKDVLANIKPCLILFIPVISYSIYRVLDKTMIGSISNTIELGNYESAEKIINIPISFITALGTVMLPHMSKKILDEIKETIYETFELTYFVITPMIIGLVVIANNFSNIFFGSGFEKTGNIIRILSITVLFSSTSNVIRNNFLIPLKKDNIYVYSTIFGAVINIICNTIFITMYGAYGACIGTILAEAVVMFYQIMKTRKEINYVRVIKIFTKYFIKSCIVGMIIFIIA